MSRHLMARFRHLHVASEWRVPHIPLTDEDRQSLKFNWDALNEEFYKQNRSSLTKYKTTLDNGDEIHIGYAGEGYPEFPDYWDYQIYGPILKENPMTEYSSRWHAVYDDRIPDHTRNPVGWREYLGNGGNGGEPRGTDMGGSYTSPVDAMRAAENHYMSIDHASRKRHDSGVDYEEMLRDLPKNQNGPVHQFDENFGDIFGEQS